LGSSEFMKFCYRPRSEGSILKVTANGYKTQMKGMEEMLKTISPEMEIFGFEFQLFRIWTSSGTESRHLSQFRTQLVDHYIGTISDEKSLYFFGHPFQIQTQNDQCCSLFLMKSHCIFFDTRFKFRLKMINTITVLSSCREHKR
jgi:hypothetical protein